VNLVAAALDDGIELTAGGMAEFGGELVLENGEFRHALVGNVQAVASGVFPIVIDTLYVEIVVAGPLTANGRPFAQPDAAAARHSRAEQREIDHTQRQY